MNFCLMAELIQLIQKDLSLNKFDTFSHKR